MEEKRYSIMDDEWMEDIEVFQEYWEYYKKMKCPPQVKESILRYLAAHMPEDPAAPKKEDLEDDEDLEEDEE